MLGAEETCDCLLPSSTTPWGTIISIAVFVVVVVIGAVLAWRRSVRRSARATDAHIDADADVGTAGESTDVR